MRSQLLQDGRWGWQELYSFSEKLVHLTVLEKQCELIQSTLQKRINVKARLWLSEIFHPLPGETIPDCVDYGKPNALVKRSITRRKPTFAHRQDGTRLASLPMFAQNRTIGAIELEFISAEKPDQLVMDFLQGISSHSALALLLARQNAVKEWRSQQLTLLRQVNLKIAQQREGKTIFKNIVELIQHAYHFYFVGIYTFNEATGKLDYRASTVAKMDEVSFTGSVLPIEIPLGKGLIGKAAELRKEIITQDVHRSTKYRKIDGLLATKSEATFPLLVENKLLGILDVQTDQTNGFHENDLVVLRVLADNVAAAINGAKLVDIARRHVEQLNAVSEVSRLLASILDVDELLQQVVTIISQRFGHPFVHFFIFDQRRKRLIFKTGTGDLKRVLRGREFGFGLDDPHGIVPMAARQAATIVVNDVSKEPAYRDNDLPPVHTRAEMVVPLIYANEVLGVLDIQSDTLDAFNKEDQFLLEALAASISITLRNANLYRTERWRNQVAESFKEIASLFSNQFSLGIIFEVILKKLMQNLPSDAAAVWMVKQNSMVDSEMTFNAEAVIGADQAEIQKLTFKDQASLNWMYQVLASEKPVIRAEEHLPEPLGGCLRMPRQYSAIATAIRKNDQVLGLIVLVNHENNCYGDEAASILETFAGYTSIAIQNSQLYSESVEQAFISSVMLQVAQTVQSAESIQGLFDTVAGITPLLIGVDRCAFYLLDKSTSQFQLMAQEGFEGEDEVWLKNWVESKDGVKSLDSIRKSKIPLAVRQIKSGSFSGESKVKPRITGFALLPLYAGEELLGAFLAEHEQATSASFDPASGDDQRLNVLQGIARQTAIALQNIQLKENEQSEGYITAVLLQVAQTVVSSNDLHETCENIAATLTYLVGVETVLIYEFIEEYQEFQLKGSYSDKWNFELERLNHKIKAEEFQLLDQMKANPKNLFLPLQNNSPLSWSKDINSNSSRATISELNRDPNVLYALPLLVRSKLFGALLVSESSQNIAFREKRFEIVRDVAQQLAMAIQSDRLNIQMVENERMKREMQLANEIQRTFLPKSLPRVGGWEVDVHWHPARVVSGDFYDAFQLPDGRLGLVIADVSDKGIPAALYMTVTRTLVHASAMDADSPARTLSQVNKLLVENSEEGLFTTVFYAVINPKSGEMIYCNAGHNRPLWLRQNKKEVAWLRKGGTALGVFPDIELLNSAIPLTKGDCVILYTDGVSEARGANDRLYGVLRLKKFLQSHLGSSVSEILNGLDEELADFRQNQPQSDDITVMAVRRID